MQKNVVSFGEVLWDLFPTGPVLGGAPFNVAFRVSQLGDVGMIISRVGADRPGKKALTRMKALGMNPRLVQSDRNYPTGTVDVTVDARGNPEFFIVPNVAYDFIAPTSAARAVAKQADCFCYGTLVQRSAQARRALTELLKLRRGKLNLLDINLRPQCFTVETITASLKRARVVKMNLAEAHTVADLFEIANSSLAEFCDELLEEWPLECCLVTLGEYGVFGLHRDSGPVYVPGYRVRVQDGCGAGDAFLAGFIHSYLRKRSLGECCQLGNALGAIVASQTGATQPAGIAEVSAFLRRKRTRLVEPSLERYWPKAMALDLKEIG